jgi:DNA (cytosine-5)-methyltransferase 1
MSRPRLLDLFCGAGGAAMGYHRAGFDVTGVDIRPQPRYPFAFVQADALDYCREHGRAFDVIHASPPCQAYSPLRALNPGIEYPDLLPITRATLCSSGVPWVIENVMSAPLGGVVLCGGMFGLRTYRHRRFESSAFLWRPDHPRHRVRTSTRTRRSDWDAGLHVSVTGDVGVYVGLQALGIDWMTGAELSQAVPPAYTEYLGRQLLHVLSTSGQFAS